MPDVSRRGEVVLITGQLGPGGSERQLFLLARALAERGRHVSVACLSTRDRPHGEALRACKIDVALFPRQASWDLRRLQRLRSWLRGRSPAVVCSFGEFAAAYTRLALVGRSRPPRSIALVRRGASHLSRVKRALIGWTFRTTDVVAANSEAGRRYASAALRLPPGSVGLLPNLVPDEVFEAPSRRQATRAALGVSRDDRVVLYIGRDARAKDIPTLCRTLSHLQRAVPVCRAWVVGPGLAVPPPGLAGDSMRAHWMGERDDTRDLIDAADALLLTSASEGSPNVVLEALARGCPVVTTDVGDVRGLVEPCGAGRVCAIGDAEGLATALAELLRDPPGWRRAAERAVPVLRSRHGREAVLEQFIRLLDGPS
ncbi:MAG: glycosyltransferase family 4 protein, partial [Acidobacteriota bacterium]